MTYSELIALVQDYLEEAEASFVANLPTFVKLAEEEIYLRVQLKDLRKNSTSALTASVQYLGTPSDYLAPYSLSVSNAGEYSFLIHKDVNFIREAFPNVSTTGLPRYYAEFDDDTFILGPTPNSNYTVELHYYFRPTSIVDDSSSWVGTNAVNALLFGTILHGYIYLKGDQDIIAAYKEKFERAIQDLTILQEGRNNKDTYRTPNKRLEL